MDVSKKQSKRQAKKNLTKIVDLLSFSEKKKMLEATSVLGGTHGSKKTSMGIKTWVINNISDKSRFYAANLLVPPMKKMPLVEVEVAPVEVEIAPVEVEVAPVEVEVEVDPVEVSEVK